VDPAVEPRARRRPETWSPLEYACHLRDMLLVQRERVLTARRVHRPVAAPMGRDERVDHDGYAEQDPVDVQRQLADAALMFGTVLDRLPDTDWTTVLVYPYPAPPTERTVAWVALHSLHEIRHHLLDIRRQL
jgi:DinB family protein